MGMPISKKTVLGRDNNQLYRAVIHSYIICEE